MISISKMGSIKAKRRKCIFICCKNNRAPKSHIGLFLFHPTKFLPTKSRLTCSRQVVMTAVAHLVEFNSPRKRNRGPDFSTEKTIRIHEAAKDQKRQLLLYGSYLLWKHSCIGLQRIGRTEASDNFGLVMLSKIPQSSCMQQQSLLLEDTFGAVFFVLLHQEIFHNWSFVLMAAQFNEKFCLCIFIIFVFTTHNVDSALAMRNLNFKSF